MCLCGISLGLMGLYLFTYKAFGQIPPITQTTESAIGFSESSYTIVQGQTAEIVITLNAPAQKDVSIEYETSDETAQAGRDYHATSGTLTIPAGALSGKLTIPTVVSKGGARLRSMSMKLRSPSIARMGSTTTRIYLVPGPDSRTCT